MGESGLEDGKIRILSQHCSQVVTLGKVTFLSDSQFPNM